MNLAQVVDYDPDTRSYRISLERAYQPNRRNSAPAQVEVREHHAPRKDDAPGESGMRRALRQAGKEVIAALRAGGQRLKFEEISKALPAVSEGTLQCRLSFMVARGDVIREGEKGDYRYMASTEVCS